MVIQAVVAAVRLTKAMSTSSREVDRSFFVQFCFKSYASFQTGFP